MKKIMIIAALCVLAFPLLVSCVSTPTPSTPYEYQTIIEAPGATGQKLYSASLQWIATAFSSARDVIEYANQAEGLIIGNGVVDVYYTFIAPVPTRFTIRIETKDGKARLTFNNVHLPSGVPFNNNLQKNAFAGEAGKIAASYKSFVLSSGGSSW